MRLSILVAAAIVIALQFIVELRWAADALRLFSTFVHELCHALAAWGTGGSVVELALNLNASGHVLTRGGWAPLINSAGYVGTTLIGATMILAVSRGLARSVTFVLALLSGVMIVLSLVSFDVFAILTTCLYTVILWQAARLADDATVEWIAAFIGVQLLFDSFTSLADLWHITTYASTHTDALNMAAYTSVPATVWVVVWIMFSVLIALWTLRAVVRSK